MCWSQCVSKCVRVCVCVCLCVLTGSSIGFPDSDKPAQSFLLIVHKRFSCNWRAWHAQISNSLFKPCVSCHLLQWLDSAAKNSIFTCYKLVPPLCDFMMFCSGSDTTPFASQRGLQGRGITLIMTRSSRIKSCRNTAEGTQLEAPASPTMCPFFLNVSINTMTHAPSLIYFLNMKHWNYSSTHSVPTVLTLHTQEMSRITRNSFPFRMRFCAKIPRSLSDVTGKETSWHFADFLFSTEGLELPVTALKTRTSTISPLSNANTKQKMSQSN